MLTFVSSSFLRTVLLGLGLLLHTLDCAELKAYNCNTNVASTGVADVRTFAVGDKLTLCVHFLPQDVKIGFTVTVDTYQALTMRRTFEALNNVNTDLMFQASNSYPLSRQVVS